MEITQAKIILTNLIKSKTDELQATQLALDLLNNTFKADFVSLETAQKEANDAAITLNESKATIETLTADKEASDKALSDAQTLLNDKEATIADLTSQVADLTAQPVDITPIKKPVEEIKP